MKQVAIIGAGITGLTAAYRIQEWARGKSIRVTLFETSDRVGGVIRSMVIDGAVLEGGPDSILTRKPEAIRLSQDLGIENELIGTNPHVKGAYIFRRGQLHPIPQGLEMGIPKQLDLLWHTSLLSFAGKLRAVQDLWLPKRMVGEDIGLGPLLRYRFGHEVVDVIVAPMLSGIYAGDVDRLSARSAAPHIYQLAKTHRSLLLAGRQQESTPSRASSPQPKPVTVFQTFRRGMETLTHSLKDRLTDVDLRLNAEVTDLARETDGRYRLTAGGQTFSADAVLIATPSHRAASLLKDVRPALADLLNRVPYADLAVVGALYRPEAISRPLDKTGFLVPKIEGLNMTAVTWVTSKWDYPGTSDWRVIRIFFGRSGDSRLTAKTDGDLVETALRELKLTMGLSEKPERTVVTRISSGMPQYLVGHGQWWDRVQERLTELPGLYLAGAAYDGVGIPDCVRQANQVGQQMTEYLESL